RVAGHGGGRPRRGGLPAVAVDRLPPARWQPDRNPPAHAGGAAVQRGRRQTRLHGSRGRAPGAHPAGRLGAGAVRRTAKRDGGQGPAFALPRGPAEGPAGPVFGRARRGPQWPLSAVFVGAALDPERPGGSQLMEAGVCATIVVHRPDLGLLGRAVAAIAPQVDELVLFDNGGDGALEPALRELARTHRCTLLRSPANVGLAAGFN